jgi:hypothetical protein
MKLIQWFQNKSLKMYKKLSDMNSVWLAVHDYVVITECEVR